MTVAQYHIPLLIYSPKHIAPGTVDRLVSQIDLAPHQADAGRALLGNFQKLGYLKDGELEVLSPRQQIESYQVGAQNVQSRMAAADPARVDDAVAYYQGASLLFQQHSTQVH